MRLTLLPPILLVAVIGGMPRICDAAPTSGASSLRIMTVDDAVMSGPAPKTDADFAALQQRGVKTIISVDGATPDVAAARDHGMSYVHLPIGYDGPTENETARIARAIRDLPGPVYVHCFHGKHRGPTAAAVAEICLGRITNDKGMALLKQAGTSPKYPGLWAAVREAHLLTTEEIDAAPADFPERYHVTGYVSAMVRIDRVMDHLDMLQAAGWTPPPDHPDLVASREAHMLADDLTLLLLEIEKLVPPAAPSGPSSAPTSGRASRANADSAPELQLPARAAASPEKTADFVRKLRESADVARSLAAAIDAENRPAADQHLQALNASCDACHRDYRN